MEYTFQWLIENYSHCFPRNERALISPEFFVKRLESTTWFLCLFPKSVSNETKVYTLLSLQRKANDDGPENISIKFKLSILGEDGSDLISCETKRTFRRDHIYESLEFLQIDDWLLHRKNVCLPREKIIVICKMSMNEGDIHIWGLGCARTRIGIKRISFIHVVEDFSTLEPNQNKTFTIQSPTVEECLTSSIYLDDSSCCDDRIMVKITPINENLILTKCKISLLDASGNVKMCGDAGIRFKDERKKIRKISLAFRKKDILCRKDKYLPEDKLTLFCECTFYTGEEILKMERTEHEIPSAGLYQIKNEDPRNNGYNVAQNLSACPSLGYELDGLYNTQLLTDVELKTKTKSFRAHKVLLSARSHVFQRMFINDMKERSDCIEVNDLEDDTLESFLRFLYSDNLEIIPWESAVNLYYAADKYGVEKLKVICSSILLDNVSISTATELLLLADRHKDSELQKAVTHFILKHHVQVFCSDEWENLIETNPTLSAKIMLLKCIQIN